MEHSTMANNLDIIRNLVQFIDAKQYLFFATVSKTWNKAWGGRPAITSVAGIEIASERHDKKYRGVPRTTVLLCPL